MTAKLSNSIDGTYTRMLRAIHQISWTDHLTNLELYGNLSKLSEKIKQRRLKFAGHCFRHTELPASQLILWQPKKGTQNRGGHRKTFVDRLKDDIGLGSAEEVAACMKNRDVWRSMTTRVCRLKQTHRHEGFKVRPDDIQWVLTVPAIWTDGAKQFMRMAAEMAGIKNENLMIALEPEAASILCMHTSLCTEDPMTKPFTTVKGFPKGTRYMVVDMGGGTVDIIVHEVVRDECLKELAPPTGGHWGGTTVDERFITLLKHIVGTDVYDMFAKECADAVIDLYRGFEVKKRGCKIEQKIIKTSIAIPHSLVWTFEKTNPGCNIAKRTADDRKYKGKIIWNTDKLRVDSDIMCSFFDTSVEMTIKEIACILSQPSGAGVNTILLVGGCAESPLIQEKIKARFPEKRLVVPKSAGMAVLRGAVMFGHRPTTIVSRVARYSYGVRVYRDFDDGIHPSSKLMTVDRKQKCQDVFGVHVQKGEELRFGEAKGSKRYTCLEADQTSLVFDFYTSTDKNPSFVTDPGCTFIGRLEVMLTGAARRSRAAFVSIIFGGTELVVQAVDEETGEKTQAEFKFLTD